MIYSFWRPIVILIGALGLIALLASCASQAVELAPDSALPAFILERAEKFQDAYRFAISNPHDLETIPCYCGCGTMGHRSNLDCYIDAFKPDGKIIFDEHASACGICVDITQDVMILKGQGKLPSAIRAFIDAKYSQFGPGTDTPLPST